MTMAQLKERLVPPLQNKLFNPLIKWALAKGLMPGAYALLETTGRRSGLARQTAVGNGLVGDSFWIVAEHGARAAYVRNIGADPRVRVRIREGRRQVWRSDLMTVRIDLDPPAR
jgi:hypothetical protein